MLTFFANKYMDGYLDGLDGSKKDSSAWKRQLHLQQTLSDKICIRSQSDFYKIFRE